MLFSAAVVLSAFAPALAGPLARGGIYPRGDDHKLYARAEVKSQDGSICAQFEFEGYKTGDPTWIKIHDIKGLTTDPSLGGPFLYHIHTNPVPDDGNCTKTLAHLDPLSVTEGFICNPAFPQYCQTGDFSGKHGKLNGTDDGYVGSVEYSDAYVRFFPKSHSLLGRSIVIHSSNKTRLACGNIISQLDGTADDNFAPTGKPSEYVTDYPTAAPVPPGPAVIMSNGTEAPDQSSLPYPLPQPAYPLWKAVNVKLTTITRTVTTSSGEHTVTQPKEKKVAGTGPFGGW